MISSYSQSISIIIKIRLHIDRKLNYNLYDIEMELAADLEIDQFRKKRGRSKFDNHQQRESQICAWATDTLAEESFLLRDALKR